MFGDATVRGGQSVFRGAPMWRGLVKKALFVTVVVVVAARKAGEEEKRRINHCKSASCDLSVGCSCGRYPRS